MFIFYTPLQLQSLNLNIFAPTPRLENFCTKVTLDPKGYKHYFTDFLFRESKKKTKNLSCKTSKSFLIKDWKIQVKKN